MILSLIRGELVTMSKKSNNQWYVLTSKPREEQRAFDNLAGQGYDVFLPKVSRVKKRQGKQTVALEPLFPNYLFIRLDEHAANFNAVRSTRGVGSFVRFGLYPTVMNEALIDQLKADTSEGEAPKSLDELLKLSAGDNLDITEGPFKGLQAIYKAKDGLERSIILINLLGQQNEVVIENKLIEKNKLN